MLYSMSWALHNRELTGGPVSGMLVYEADLGGGTAARTIQSERVIADE